MEPLFENRYTADAKMMVEFARRYRVGPRPAVRIPFMAVYVLMTLLTLHLGIWDAMYMIIIIAGLCYAVTAILPYWYVWLMRRADKKDNDGVIPETVITFGDTIQIFEGMVHLTIEYHKVVRVVRLRHSYCLMTSKKTAVLIREDAFTKGNFEEFKQFLRDKYPNRQIPE